MKYGVVGALLLVMGVATGVAAQEECPTGKQKILVPAISPVFGEGPLWATTGATTAEWVAPEKPVAVLWVRDLEVTGPPAILTGQLRGTPTTKVLFAERGSTLGVKQEKFVLSGLGTKPGKATLKDVQRYAFFQTDVWFPAAGCYEVTGRIGKQTSTVYFRVAVKEEKGAKPGSKTAAKTAK